MSFDLGLPSSEERRRKPIPSKTRKKLMTTPRKCMWCRKQPVQEIHHIDGNPLNNKPRNLIGLCGTCHNKVRDGQISKHQLLRRLGRKSIKKAPKRQTPRRKHRTPLERMAEQLKRDF